MVLFREKERDNCCKDHFILTEKEHGSRCALNKQIDAMTIHLPMARRFRLTSLSARNARIRAVKHALSMLLRDLFRKHDSLEA